MEPSFRVLESFLFQVAAQEMFDFTCQSFG